VLDEMGRNEEREGTPAIRFRFCFLPASPRPRTDGSPLGVCMYSNTMLILANRRYSSEKPSPGSPMWKLNIEELKRCKASTRRQSRSTSARWRSGRRPRPGSSDVATQLNNLAELYRAQASMRRPSAL